MARLIYGVSGEGFGHSSRARRILRHLERGGHQVQVVSYGQGVRALRDDFDVFEIEGLTISSRDNRVSVLRTLLDNLGRLPEGVRAVRALRHRFKARQPDAVLTDFEPMTAYLARHYDRPLISIDNQHRMRFMEYPCPRALRRDARLTEAVIRAMVPWPDVCLVTTFYFGKVLDERTLLYPPILRQEVRELTPRREEHVLVYVTRQFESLLEILRDYGRERFLVYGTDHQGSDGPLEYRGFSREGFLADLAGCKAVVATAGFTLITEALHLRKPYLALPMEGQFEQQLNALLLEELGYGRNGRHPRRETVGDFFYHLPEYETRLAEWPAEDEQRLLEKLDELLADDAALARDLHARRHED